MPKCRALGNMLVKEVLAKFVNEIKNNFHHAFVNNTTGQEVLPRSPAL